MLNRRAAAVLFLGLFLALLASSAGHNHLQHEKAAASCVFCNVALGPAAAALEVPLAAPANWAVEPIIHRAPALAFPLRLDHSGGAPPA